MSWVEDEGIDAYCEEQINPRHVISWKYGKHTDKKGNTYLITDMTDEHLINTIRYFENKYDVTVLRNELIKRKLNI